MTNNGQMYATDQKFLDCFGRSVWFSKVEDQGASGSTKWDTLIIANRLICVYTKYRHFNSRDKYIDYVFGSN